MKAKIQRREEPQVTFGSLIIGDWFTFGTEPEVPRVKRCDANISNTLALTSGGNLVSITHNTSDLVAPIQVTITY